MSIERGDLVMTGDIMYGGTRKSWICLPRAEDKAQKQFLG